MLWIKTKCRPAGAEGAEVGVATPPHALCAHTYTQICELIYTCSIGASAQAASGGWLLKHDAKAHCRVDSLPLRAGILGGGGSVFAGAPRHNHPRRHHLADLPRPSVHGAVGVRVEHSDWGGVGDVPLGLSVYRRSSIAVVLCRGERTRLSRSHTYCSVFLETYMHIFLNPCCAIFESAHTYIYIYVRYIFIYIYVCVTQRRSNLRWSVSLKCGVRCRRS